MTKNPFARLSPIGIVFAALSLAAAHGETEPSFSPITLDPEHFHAALVQILGYLERGEMPS
jgi:hypothetical protein